MFYTKACFAIAGERFLPSAEELLSGFETEIQTSCIGSVSECFEGDPPFRARGCLSQATSVGGLLYIHSLIEQWKKSVAKEKGEKPAKKCVRKKK
jgi:glycogen debranching enzyme